MNNSRQLKKFSLSIFCLTSAFALHAMETKQEWTTIDRPTVITEPGSYRLMNNLNLSLENTRSTENTGIVVKAKNVWVNMNEYAIFGNNNEKLTPISTQADGVAIDNGLVCQFPNSGICLNGDNNRLFRITQCACAGVARTLYLASYTQSCSTVKEPNVKTTNRQQPYLQDIKHPMKIVQPGIYILRNDLVVTKKNSIDEDNFALIIESDNVSIDLNGYTLRGDQGVQASGIDIRARGQNGIGICNGVIEPKNKSLCVGANNVYMKDLYIKQKDGTYTWIKKIHSNNR